MNERGKNTETKKGGGELGAGLNQKKGRKIRPNYLKLRLM